jgi:hypothetical protein
VGQEKYRLDDRYEDRDTAWHWVESSELSLTFAGGFCIGEIDGAVAGGIEEARVGEILRCAQDDNVNS